MAYLSFTDLGCVFVVLFFKLLPFLLAKKLLVFVNLRLLSKTSLTSSE